MVAPQLGSGAVDAGAHTKEVTIDFLVQDRNPSQGGTTGLDQSLDLSNDTEPATAPCRLAVFLAHGTHLGVVLRRGPSAWAQLAVWDRRTDHFTPGQWFHGRVHERRCDLSTDGRLFVYFACKHGPRRDDEGIGECWTAISRPPYFTALALWPNLGAWYGGGVFTSDRDLLLDASCGLEPHPKHRPPRRLRVAALPGDTAPWEQRLLRDGWRLMERGFDPRTHRRIGRREIWEKTHRDGALKLCCEIADVDFRRYGGPYSSSYWLETGSELIPIPGADWVDWESGSRITFARDGKLFAAELRGDDLGEGVLLFDFNQLQPDQVASPDRARRW